MFIWSYYIYDAILEDKAVAVKYEVAIIAIESWMCLLVIIGGLLIYYRIPIDTNFVINYVTHSQQRRSILSPHNQQQFLGTNNTINNNDLLLATGSDTDSNNGSQNAIGSGVNTVNSVNTLNTMNLNRIDNGYGNSADNNSLTSVNSQVSEIESQIRVFRRSVLGVQFNNNNNNNNFNFNISNNNNITSNINSGRNIVGNEKLENDKPSVLNNTFGSLAIPSVNQLNDRSVSEDIVIADQLNVNSTHGEVVAGPTAAKETLGAVQVSESRKFQQVHRTESKQFLGDWFSLTKSLVVMLNQNDDECIIWYVFLYDMLSLCVVHHPCVIYIFCLFFFLCMLIIIYCNSYETYKPDDIMAELVCKHQFHRDCVTDWLLNNPTCPYCRTRVLKANF